MSEVTASEIVGELKKISRLYEVLKKADEIVSFIAEKERYQRDLEVDISEATRTLASLSKQCEDLGDQNDNARKDIEKAKLEYKKIMEDANTRAASVVSAARSQAASILEAAKVEVKSYKDSLETLKEEKNKAQNELKDLGNMREKLMSEMKARRDEFLRVLN
jgi:chromosome segregation ATPase